MTRCPECSTAEGRDVDHVPEYRLPPLLVRFEHFLATKGALGRPSGREDPTLPTKGGKVPASPLARSNVRGIVQRAEEILTDLGYLRHAGPRTWTSVTGRDVRDLSVKEISSYLTGRFPGDRCRTHQKGCTRCCLPHHLGVYNWSCVLFQKLALWLHFEERLYGKPVWGADKVADVLGVARRRPYKVPPPDMVPIERAYAFREWLEASPDRVRVAYGHMLGALQTFGLRYEELANAEYPLAGPTIVLDRAHGQLHVLGKGRGGGKVRHVTLTPERAAYLDGILAWRKALGPKLRKELGRDPDPVLFPTFSVHRDASGLRHDGKSSTWNRQLRAYAEAFNAERPDVAIDPELATSHKIGRPVFGTQLNRSKVSTKVGMEEMGIEDFDTYARYDRPDLEERRRQLAGMDRGTPKENGGPVAALERVIAELGQDPAHVVPILRGVQEMLRQTGANA